MKGIHLLADITKIARFDLLETVEGVEPLMRRIINEMRLNVVGEVKHQFEPYGATLLYLLAESHLSIHTYVDEKYCAIDLYCCNPNIDMYNVLDIIYQFFECQSVIRRHIMDR